MDVSDKPLRHVDWLSDDRIIATGDDL